MLSPKATWIDRRLDWLVLRANNTCLKQNGSPYGGDAFAQSLPAFLQAYPNFVTTPETVAQLRKYDVCDRNRNFFQGGSAAWGPGPVVPAQGCHRERMVLGQKKWPESKRPVPRHFPIHRSLAP